MIFKELLGPGGQSGLEEKWFLLPLDKAREGGGLGQGHVNSDGE